MQRSMRENLVFTAVTLALLGGLVLFGCSRSEREAGNVQSILRQRNNVADKTFFHGIYNKVFVLYFILFR
jgi:hypothetical protein